MSVYKPFTTSDVVVTPFKVNKSFTFKGASEFTSSNVGIDRFIGENIPYISGSNLTGQIVSQSQALIYESTKQLYYSNFLFGEDGSPANLPQFNNDGTITIEGGSGSYQPMYDNYLPNTLDANRLFPTASGDRIGVISIPSNLFGEYIKPGTFSLEYSGSISGEITDNGDGHLFNGGFRVGDIIYQHGIVILTAFGSSITGSVYGVGLNSGYGTASYGTSDVAELNSIITGNNITCSFQSTTTIYESQYKCTFNPNEYNYTQNPSAISSSLNSGIVYDFLTGSYFEPYITTVGLYNNANQLVAVGKLSQPLQSSNTTDTTVLVNLDL
tara:strand:+ start:90 stop:1070 length:981 start_codon:yes stop_codon:yes gene_type:complete